MNSAVEVTTEATVEFRARLDCISRKGWFISIEIDQCQGRSCYAMLAENLAVRGAVYEHRPT
jgi:hypothetical protein